MAQESKRASGSFHKGDRSREGDPKGKLEAGPQNPGPSIFDTIQQIAHRHVRARTGEESVFRQLSLWWCEHYGRPLKDPLLLEYTTEELIYEYYLINEHKKYQKELDEEAADKIEEMKEQAALEWADEEEAREAELEAALEAKAAKKKEKKAPPKEEPKIEEPPAYDPLKDPANLAWMEKEMKDAKLFFGEDFGEDLSLKFEDPKKGK